MLNGLRRKLSGTQLEALLTELYAFFYELEPPHLRHEEMKSREFIIHCRDDLPQEGLKGPDAKVAVADVAANIAEWLTSYLE